MRWTFVIFHAVILLPGINPLIAAQQTSRVEELVTQLENEDTGKSAAADLQALYQSDAQSRKYIVDRLLTLIQGKDQGPLWWSSVKLAGDLKIAEAAPPLADSLRKDHRSGAFRLALDARLYDDVVAKSLSQIGDRAVVPVAALFADGDTLTRRRAAIVLSNIGTPNAREAILRQIDREPDPDLRTLMMSEVKSD